MRRFFVAGLLCSFAACEPGTLFKADGVSEQEERRLAASMRHLLGDTGKPKDYNKTLRRRAMAATTLPSAFNWKKRGVVTRAKDQGGCGSCWAFAVAGAIESKIMIGRGPALDLSEQQQMFCNTAMGGCSRGGSMRALRFYEDHGPMQEHCTGYASRDGDCASLGHCDELPYRASGYYTVNARSIAEVKQSLYADGPSYFRFDVHNDFYTFWGLGTSGEVYRNTRTQRSGGHAVLIIGWDDGKQAYLLKNSWGETAGPNGDGTFWMAYQGHRNNLSFGMANIDVRKVASGSDPIGVLDRVANGVAYGWACDHDAPGRSIYVHLYVGGPTGSGAKVYGAYANKANEQAVSDACGGGSANRFAYRIPNYAGEPVYAYGINVRGGKNALLAGSPQGGPVQGCGNGVCTLDENGKSCPQDCCDADTPCSATRQDQNTHYCRSMNGGAYGWITETQASVYCANDSHVCSATATCGGVLHTCKSAPAGWAEGKCSAVCGNGKCEDGEDGASCGQDCCDAKTLCSQTKQNEGSFYCRSMNGGSYGWLTEDAAKKYCSTTTQLCKATAVCEGILHTCKSLPAGWAEGTCEPVCGDGICEGSENGSSCGQDCCDASTACSQTQQNGGVYYCRSMNNGPYAWVTESTTKTYCNSSSEICKSTARCGGTLYNCSAVPTKWTTGTCTPPAVCGNGVCESGENGSSCGSDCCDASTSCSQTRQNQGLYYCRSMNGGLYRWVTESTTKTYCNSSSEICKSTARCGGTLYTCSAVPTKWTTGTCTPPAVCGNGVCESGESGSSCGSDCCDASTSCSQTKQNKGLYYCRSMNGGSYRWVTESTTKTYCDSSAEVCKSTARCGGILHTCKSIPYGWAAGSC